MNAEATKISSPPRASASPAHGRLLQRECACGGSAGISGKCSKCNDKRLQRKLTIGSSHDPLELEADRVADQVLRSPSHAAVTSSPPRIQRFAGHAAGAGQEAPASVDRVLSGAGTTLDAGLRVDMERRFGHDFSNVRVHSGAAAERSAQDVNANAYTVGRDIVFGAGRYEPGTHEGRRLIAHELTHVVQQVGQSTRGWLQRKEQVDVILTSMQGLRMSELLQRLSQLSSEVLNDEETGRNVGGPRLLVAMRAVKSKRDGDLQFVVNNRRGIEALPPDQAADILGFFGSDVAVNAVKPALGSGPENVKRTPANDVGKQWGARRNDFLVVASAPLNGLNAHQHFQIWFQYWIERLNTAVRLEESARVVASKIDKVAYAKNMDLFLNSGMRTALGPEYQRAADLLETANTFLNEQTTILNWLEDWVDSAHHQVTFSQVNDKAVAEAKIRGIYQYWMEPIVLQALGAASIGRATRTPVGKDESPQAGTSRPPEVAKGGISPAHPNEEPAVVGPANTASAAKSVDGVPTGTSTTAQGVTARPEFPVLAGRPVKPRLANEQRYRWANPKMAKGNFIDAELDADGSLSVTVKANGPDELRRGGTNLLDDVFAHFGNDKIREFRSLWVRNSTYRANYDEYTANLAKGMGPEEAAWNTWTGRQLRARGFKSVNVPSHGDNPDVVSPEFRK